MALTRIFEPREEVHTFLSDCNSPLSDPKWVASLAYLASIFFDKLRSLNLSLQGRNTNVLVLPDKATALKRKVERLTMRAEGESVKMSP